MNNPHDSNPLTEPDESERDAGQICPVCKSALPAGYSPGLCPACLFQAALGDGETAVDERIRADSLRSERLRYLGDYVLAEEIGRGGMGVVYRATQSSLGRAVAVKVLIGGQWASEQARRRFQVEARAAATVRHPSIIKVHEVGEHEGQPYFSMDLLEGEDLARLLKRQRPAIDQAVRWSIDICDAVACAHEHGVAHRDLKPSNVIIDQQDRPVVTDFGLARIEQNPSEIAPLTLTGQIFGTPGYMAPERLRGVSTNASGEDIYALGALLHALLTGKPPFHDHSSWPALGQALEEDLPSLQRLNPKVPADLDAICLKALARRPEERYPSVTALRQDLERFHQGLPVSARPISVWKRGWRWMKRRRRTVVIVGLIAALTALAIFRNQVARLAVRHERAEAQKTQNLLSGWAEAQRHLSQRNREAAAETLTRVAQAVHRLPTDEQPVADRELQTAALEAWRLPSLTPILRLPAKAPLAVALSRDGKRLGLLNRERRGSGSEDSSQGRLQIYDLAPALDRDYGSAPRQL